MRTSSETRCTSAPAPRQVSGATTPEGRTTSCGRSCRRSRAIRPRQRQRFPWISFQGRWGELQKAFYNGPTGPNLKGQWTEPISWSEDWRDRSYAVPTGGVFGTSATDLFCSGVATGSEALARLLRNPLPMLILIGVLLGLLAFVIVRVTWHPVAPLRLARRRTWGQILSASGRMYVKRLRLFLGIGLVLIPFAFVITFLQWLLWKGIDLIGSVTGEAAGAFAFVAVVIGATLTLLGLGLVQAATACALVEIDAGRPVGAIGAYRLAAKRLRPLARSARPVRARLGRPHLDGVPDPGRDLARRPLGAPRPRRRARGALGVGALRRSAELVRSRWLRVGTLVGLGAAVAIAAGPLIGVALIFLTNAPLALLNVFAGAVYALAMPLVALVTSYAYFDARTRHELEPVDRRTELPAEITLESA